MRIRSFIYAIITTVCFISEILLLIYLSDLAFIPILISLLSYGFFHFLEDLEDIFSDNEKKL